jgi:hypothetical protein
MEQTKKTKTFRVWHGDGTQENIESIATPTVEKKSDGLRIKIGKRKIENAVGFTEHCEAIKIIPR